MLVVDNFLIIFSLEVGGQFIGWFGLITSALILPLSVVFLIGLSIDKDLKFLREKLESLEIDTTNMGDGVAIQKMREYLITTLILSIILSSIYLVASALLIRGTINRNHRQIKPAKNISAFLAVFSVFRLLIHLSINSMVNVVIYIYVFAIINSLWRKIREEESGERRTSVEQHFYPVIAQPKV